MVEVVVVFLPLPLPLTATKPVSKLLLLLLAGGMEGAVPPAAMKPVPSMPRDPFDITCIIVIVEMPLCGTQNLKLKLESWLRPAL